MPKQATGFWRRVGGFLVWFFTPAKTLPAAWVRRPYQRPPRRRRRR